MAIYYLDTSAIVKWYIQEGGSEFVISLFENAEPNDIFYTSILSLVEYTSTVLRRNKGNEFSDTTAREFLIRFDQDTRETIEIWPLDHGLIMEAMAVVEAHNLRAGDAIHMATALRIASVEPDVVMVSSDRELVEASESANITSLDPQSQDSVQRLNQIRNTI